MAGQPQQDIHQVGGQHLAEGLQQDYQKCFVLQCVTHHGNLLLQCQTHPGYLVLQCMAHPGNLVFQC
jgi:hypothetical protein